MNKDAGIKIRRAVANDEEAIWNISHNVLATSDTYPFLPNSTKEEMLKYWFGRKKQTFVAEINNSVAGVYNIKPKIVYNTDDLKLIYANLLCRLN